MKKLFLIILLLSGAAVMAQESQPAKSSSVAVKDSASDEKQSAGKKKNARIRDQFIDANGDGICDSREQGLGFKREKGAAGKQSGKKQRGRKK